MAFREKSAWITLLTTVVVYGAYFALVGPRLLARSGASGFIGPLSIAILVIIILQVVFTSAVAAADPAGAKEARDEREILIALKANQAGFYALQIGVFAAATSLYWFNNTRVMANGVFLAIVLAEVVRSGLQIVAHRRGVA